MYLEHFSLHQLPFGLTPNTDFYFGLPPHEEALEVLRWHWPPVRDLSR